MRHRLMLVDDHRMVVEALRRHLMRSYDIVSIAYDGAQAIRHVQRERFDAIVLDLHLPKPSGLELIGSLKRAAPSVRIVVVTMHNAKPIAAACVRSGAEGFVPKEAPLDELEAALRAVLSGRTYLSPAIHRTEHQTGLAASHPALARLTRRQEQLLSLIGDGLSGVEISLAIGLSASTVTFHKQNLMKALGIAADSELVRFAVLVGT